MSGPAARVRGLFLTEAPAVAEPAAGMVSNSAEPAGTVSSSRTLAISLPRTAALDRVLAWHDGIVAVPEPGATGAVIERVEASLGRLGRPVACVPPPSRHATALAEMGLRVPPLALRAIEQLGLGVDRPR